MPSSNHSLAKTSSSAFSSDPETYVPYAYPNFDYKYHTFSYQFPPCSPHTHTHTQITKNSWVFLAVFFSVFCWAWFCYRYRYRGQRMWSLTLWPQHGMGMCAAAPARLICMCYNRNLLVPTACSLLLARSFVLSISTYSLRCSILTTTTTTNTATGMNHSKQSFGNLQRNPFRFPSRKVNIIYGEGTKIVSHRLMQLNNKRLDENLYNQDD